MGILKSIAIGVLVMVATACTNAEPPSVDQVRKAARLVVGTSDPSFPKDMPVGSGTGVVIKPGYILSAFHVTTGEKHIFVGTSWADKKEAKIIKEGDEKIDLVLIYSPDAQCPCVDLAALEPSRDTPVVQVGWPLFTKVGVQFLTKGEIQGYFSHEGTSYLITTAQMAPGNSGGGTFAVINGEWKLVGIGTQVAAHGNPFIGGGFLVTWMAMGMPVDTIREFLKGTPAEQ